MRVAQMKEATKDDVGEDEEGVEGQDSFVKLDFTKSHFQNTSELKDFIVRVTEVSP
jgi:hypothetical protein